ncbi:MAG: GIY-YIG nuclease family protein [Candidatus Pacebacteria bacterium]|nr:GIY-YIG nuclease family protein [Candidatus Paceibacterota bacterium]
MFFYIYVLETKGGVQKYTGYTSNLKKRLEEHQKGFVFSTKSKLPVRLIYYEACLSETDAKRREKYLKTTGGRRFLSKRLKEYLFA